jgi:hypothetical protein
LQRRRSRPILAPITAAAIIARLNGRVALYWSPRMTVRPPQSLPPSFTRDSGLNLLEYELMSERADALGRNGLKVEKAIAALSVLGDAATKPERREQLLNDAADAVWAFFIQREICGLRSNRDAVQRYGIPKEVMARLGIIRKA